MSEIFDVSYNKGKLDIRLRALPSEAGAWGRRITERAALAGKERMEQLAPIGDQSSRLATGGRRDYPALVDRMGTNGPTYRPGGSGGGGTWTASFGVKRTRMYGRREHDPAMLVFKGTGIYRGNSPIKAKPGSVLSWYAQPGRAAKKGWGDSVSSMSATKSGSIRRYLAKSVKGQPPQTRWVTEPRRVARRSIQRSVANFPRD